MKNNNTLGMRETFRLKITQMLLTKKLENRIVFPNTFFKLHSSKNIIFFTMVHQKAETYRFLKLYNPDVFVVFSIFCKNHKEHLNEKPTFVLFATRIPYLSINEFTENAKKSVKFKKYANYCNFRYKVGFSLIFPLNYPLTEEEFYSKTWITHILYTQYHFC